MMRKGIRILCAVCLIFSAVILTTDAIRTSVTGAETNAAHTQQAEQAPYMLGEYQARSPLTALEARSRWKYSIFIWTACQPSTDRSYCMESRRRRYKSCSG